MVDGGAAIHYRADPLDERAISIAGDEPLVRLDRVPVCADFQRITLRFGGAALADQELDVSLVLDAPAPEDALEAFLPRDGVQHVLEGLAGAGRRVFDGGARLEGQDGDFRGW